MEKHIPYKDLLDQLAEGVYYVNPERQIRYWNRAAEKITGYTKDEIFGKHCWENLLLHVDEQGNHLCTNMCPLLAAMRDRTPQRAQVYLRHKQGHRVPILVKAMPILDADGEPVGAVELFEDNSARIAVIEKLKKLEIMALLDPLTGIANRRYLEMSLDGFLEQRKRYDSGVGVIFLDVDNFKSVNDARGHNVGDEVLKMVGRNLKHNSRIFDTPGRWGGEEFVVLCDKIDETELRAVAEKTRMLIANSRVTAETEDFSVTASLGATMATPEDAKESLLARADALMYRSKAEGKNRVTVG